MELRIKVDSTQVFKMLDGLAKDQVPFAAAYALTQTAKAVQGELEKEIPRVFDRPTPFTQRAVYVTPARKTRLTAQVKLKDFAVKGNPAVRYLFPETQGGGRNIKGFEKLLQNANGRFSGGVMPRGWYAIPTNAAPFDIYGNVPGSAINRILSQLQASRDPGTRETAGTAKRRGSMHYKGKSRPSRYFVVMPDVARTKHLAPGIWERVAFGFGSSIRPIFIYTRRRPSYRKRFDFNRISTTTASAQIGLQFKRGMALAMATAR